MEQLQYPSQHQTKDGENQSQMKEEVALRDPAKRKELKDIVHDDEQDAEGWQQSFAMGQVFGEFVEGLIHPLEHLLPPWVLFRPA
jgi:hypothetical protein